jgi:hypothetical protein
MLSRHVALVSDDSEISLSDLTTVAAALQKQVARDFGPIWNVRANVGAFAKLEDMPLDYWPIIIRSKLDRAGAAGYHEDDLGEPCSLVLLTDDWSVTASHEMLEMLADPWGRHLVAGPSPQDPDRRVKFLVEVCDPCSNESYQVDGIAVSDFYTPNYFDPVSTSQVRYSFNGTLTAPRQVLEGGYLAWHDPASNTWWHRSWFDGTAATDKKIPTPALVKGSCRAAVDRHIEPMRRKFTQSRPPAAASVQKDHILAAHQQRAAGLRKAIAR